MSAGAHRVQKRTSDSNWSILAVVRHLTEMLGTKLRSSVGTTRALDPHLGYGYYCDET